MQPARFRPAFLLPVLSAAALALPSAAQVFSAGVPHELEPVRVELYGQGAGTLVLPSATDGRIRALLLDDTSATTFQLEASLIPYIFFAEHPPAGALHGGVYTLVDPMSTDEAAQVARVEGEWSVDATGVGTLTALLLIDDGPAGAERIAGAVQGAFRITLREAPRQIAPPLYLPPPIDVPSSSVHVTRVGDAIGLELTPGTAQPAPIVVGIQPVPTAQAARLEPVPPTIIVDPIEPSITARVRWRWVLAL
ncbi:MAG: hypothetical protein HZA53_14125 [Planctomycetes bacterium]|nr:hypothetical protein [Planctomycetota bacterium]